MRSRAELALRGLALAAIVAWIVLAMLPRATAGVLVRGSEVASELPRLTGDAATRSVHVALDAILDATSSAWLAALRRAGTPVSWSGDALAPLALESWRTADPAGATMLLAAADSAIVSDALGALDTLRDANVVSVRLPASDGPITLTSGAESAAIVGASIRGPKAESRKPGVLFVAGAVGWEARFVIAALEEAGWMIDARLVLAPGHDIVQGNARSTPDTARHGAAILLDSAAAEMVRGVEAFVRAGGGAILAGDASRARRVASLVGWRAAAREAAPLGTLPGDSAWRGLSRIPLAMVEGRAVALETRGSAATVVARRHYAGRVAAAGYDATWRWRMAGGENSVAAHRAWWSRLVSGVVQGTESEPAGVAGAAPLAALHSALGPPADGALEGATSFPRDALANALGLFALLALVGEWLRRRARGAR